MTDEKKDGAGRVIARVSLDEADQEKAAFLADRFRVKRLPALVRLLISNAYLQEQDNDRRYGTARTARAGAKETRDEITKRIRAMDIEALNDFLIERGYLAESKGETGVGDVVERERVVSHETTGVPVLETQHYSPSTHIISYRATTLNLDQIIAELVKNKMI